RDLSAQRVITIPTDVVAALGLTPQPATIPATQAAKFFIGKADYQVSAANRFTGRYLMFRNDSPYNGSGGGTQSLDWAPGFIERMDSTAGQLVTTIGSGMLNEARVQYAHRHQSSLANGDTGSGPAITVQGVANFGGPLSGPGQNNAGFDFKQNILQ